MRLAIISTHPIQYYAPVFRALARSQAVRPKVFFTWSQTASASVVDPGFERPIAWDIPLLEGYESEFVPNTARHPGTHHFQGLRNPGLVHTIEGWEADAVLVFGWNLHSHLGALRYFKKRIPVFFRGDSTLLDRRSAWKTAARRIFLGWVYRHVDVAIAVGSNNRDYYRWCGLPAERIAFAPHAIDTRRFADPNGSHAELAARWRHELGIPAQTRTVVFAGKLQRQKDPLLLLEAFSRCGAPGRLVFVGNGELEQQLKAQAQGRRDVHFLPFQNQSAMPSVYRLGDVFALPSQQETWGLALNEAMASQRPVIASSKVGGARDLIAHNVNGWVFQSGNVDELGAALRNALVSDDTTLGSMGIASVRESARWSAEAAAAGIEEAVLRFRAGGRA